MARERGPPIPNPCTSTKLTDETKGADGAGHNWCANDDDDHTWDENMHQEKKKVLW